MPGLKTFLPLSFSLFSGDVYAKSNTRESKFKSDSVPFGWVTVGSVAVEGGGAGGDNGLSGGESGGAGGDSGLSSGETRPDQPLRRYLLCGIERVRIGFFFSFFSFSISS